MTVTAGTERPDTDDVDEQPADDTEQSEPSTEEPSLAPEKGEPETQSDADARVSELEAERDTLVAKIADAEKKRIPGLQAALDAKAREVNDAKQKADSFRNSMLEWTRKTMLDNGLKDEWDAIERKEQERTGQTLMTQAARAETMEVINDLLDSDESGDREFGRFLKAQVRAGAEGGVPVKVTPQNLGTYRKMYEGTGGKPAAATNTDPAPKPRVAAPAAAQPAPAKKPLPKQVGASGAPQTTEEAAWKPGTSVRSLFTRAFAARRDEGE